MRRLILLLAFVGFALGLSAQQDIHLRINHKLGANAFVLNASATNNLGNEFTAKRLEYYLSEITLVHDGGIETMVPNTWVLADASQPLDLMLGNFNVTNLEEVRFGIGVDTSVNHDDPALWPMGHPLAPRSPSMHWGWASGYRFIAMEGKSGTNLAQNYEIHTVEDENYMYTSVATSGEAISNGLRINLDADYLMAVKNIDLSSGPTNHGAGGISKTIVENFRDFVFSASTPTAVGQLASEVGFEMYPNPSSGAVTMKLDPALAANASIIVYDYMGRKLLEKKPAANGNLELEINGSGYYMVAVQSKGNVVATKRLIIQ